MDQQEDREKDKNQSSTSQAATGVVSKDTLLVKDYDGKLKILTGGQLKELDSMLASAEVAEKKEVPSLEPSMQLDFPKYTDIAPIPVQTHFQEPVAAKPGPTKALHFHPDDQQEIERELDKLSSVYQILPQKRYSVVKIARKLIGTHKLSFSELEFSTFVKALLSYFRQMRSLTETKTRLTDTKEQGGLAIRHETADQIISIIRELKTKIEEQDGIVVEEEFEKESVQPKEIPTSEPAPVVTKEFQPPRVKMKPGDRPTIPRVQEREERVVMEKPIQQPPQPPPPAAPPQPPPPQPLEQKAALPQKEEQEVTQPRVTAPIIQSVPPEPAIPKVVRPAQPQPTTTFIQDVRRAAPAQRVQRLTGKVDELASMTLATWRMLDPDPRIRAGKILGKIQSLEQESFTRKSQGVDAWRSSDAYRHYLSLGQASLEQGKDVAKIIEALQQQGYQTLTLDEFEAITDLNRMLRF